MQNKSIFLALDDSIIASDVRRVLMDAGLVRLKVFSTSDNMLKEAMSVSPPDLIIADTDARDRINLLNSINQLRSRFNIPVIYLMRKRNSSEPALSMDPGCDYIPKPLTDDNRLLLSLTKFLKPPSSSPAVSS